MCGNNEGGALIKNMLVKELVKELEKHPPEMEVFLDERKTEFNYGLVNSVSKTKVDFMEEPNGQVLSSYDSIVISEE